MPTSTPLNHDWLFHLGDIDPAAVHGWIKAGTFNVGGSALSLDTATWRAVQLPHDFVSEAVPHEKGDAGCAGTHGIDLMRADGEDHHAFHGYRAAGIGWYRRSLEIPQDVGNQRYILRFEGVYRNCTVFCNEHFAGSNLSGYVGFDVDITDFLRPGQPNLIAVKVDATDYEGWFYEGGGIYRNVHLVVAEAVHLALDGGVTVLATPETEVAPAHAAVSIRCNVVNQTTCPVSVQLQHDVYDASGHPVASVAAPVVLPAWDEAMSLQLADVQAPELWSVEHPALYTLTTRVLVDGVCTDTVQTRFGIRTVRFDPDQGFFLNGVHVKLQGVCCHQDHAGVGAAVPDFLQRFRIARLKEMGCNAYRSAHHPPAPALLDACDELGMLVIDENRMLNSSPEYIDQLSRMVRRDRNHPSVILWCIGNEEMIMQESVEGGWIARTLVQIVKRLDPSRLTTYANNAERTWAKTVSAEADVLGCNYHQGAFSSEDGEAESFYARFHRLYSDKPLLVTESASTLTTRGEYNPDLSSGRVPAYDVTFPDWGCSAETMWAEIADVPFVAGTFIWTGFDYRGEPLPHRWPCIASNFGVLDSCGFPKDNFWYYRAWWTTGPVLHVLPHWSWPGREGELIDVRCFTNCEAAELLLNGQSIGMVTVPRNGAARWSVPYAPGVLEVRGFRGDVVSRVARMRTTGVALKIALSVDRAAIHCGGSDGTVVTARIVDARGDIVPDAAHLLSFDIQGPAHIIGVGNGDPSSLECDHSHERHAFHGLCQVIIQSDREPGVVTLTATAPNLTTGRCQIVAS